MTRRNAPASRRSSSRGSIRRLALRCLSGGAPPTAYPAGSAARGSCAANIASSSLDKTVGFAPPERQAKANRFIEPLLEDLREAGAFLLVIQLGLERVHVDRQPALLP